MEIHAKILIICDHGALWSYALNFSHSKAWIQHSNWWRHKL